MKTYTPVIWSTVDRKFLQTLMMQNSVPIKLAIESDNLIDNQAILILLNGSDILATLGFTYKLGGYNPVLVRVGYISRSDINKSELFEMLKLQKFIDGELFFNKKTDTFTVNIEKTNDNAIPF